MREDSADVVSKEAEPGDGGNLQASESKEMERSVASSEEKDNKVDALDAKSAEENLFPDVDHSNLSQSVDHNVDTWSKVTDWLGGDSRNNAGLAEVKKIFSKSAK